MEHSASFGAWLTERRQALRLSRVELARRVGCATVTLRKIEEDARRPSPELAASLAGRLSVPQSEHATFVRVARGELAVNRLTANEQAGAAEQPHIRSTIAAPLTPLVGREHELVDLGVLLETEACRLMTIVGPGGIGKTRVALALAARHAERFADGTVIVPLAAVTTTGRVAPAILAAIGVGLQGQREPNEQLFAALRDKELLLVLDNVEQLVSPRSDQDGIAVLLVNLLSQARRVTVLATSRERLAVNGEWLYELGA